MTPPRIRGLVDKLERAVEFKMRAKHEDRAARKHDVLVAKMELLRAFEVISRGVK